MPLQATSGAASYDAFGGGVPFEPTYIEQVFATHLYTGNGSTQTINNGIDLAGKGGLVWFKNRGTSATNHQLYDSVRGVRNGLSSNTTNAQAQTFVGYDLTSLNSNGFSVGIPDTDSVNVNGASIASWTFREQPNFFKILTYTGTGGGGFRTIPLPTGWTDANTGAVIIKNISASEDWYFNWKGAAQTLKLNSTDAAAAIDGRGWGIAGNEIYVGGSANNFGNKPGNTYVVYLFATNAGGFGLTGTDNVISCGSFTTDGSGNATVDLGYEPQWVLLKSSSGTGNWIMEDNMRGWTVNPTGFTQRLLFANLSNAESAGSNSATLTSTGFTASGNLGSSNTYIYIAIRRGPMRTPTSGTSVFDPEVATDTEGQGVVKTTNFPVDLQITKSRASSGSNFTVDRLRGVSTTATDTGPSVLITNSTDAQSSGTFAITRAWNNTGFQISGAIGNSSQVYWNFRRAPGFFDVVCYRGVGFPVYEVTVNHNLGVVPELIITKYRNTTSGWFVYTPYNSSIGAGACIALNSSSASAAVAPGSINTVTSTAFNTQLPSDTSTAVAYLFASCPGVSKVGSYTGTGANLTVNCGFTGGARFVLIKRTDSTGNWFVWDTARGMVAGTDPRLALNTTDAESNANWVYTSTTGFQIVTTDASVNASGGTYIYLSIA